MWTKESKVKWRVRKKKPFLGKEKIGEEGNPGFEEELTEEVKLLILILILSP